MTDENVTTTFKSKKSDHWRMKEIIMTRHSTLRETWTEFLHEFIEDDEDERMPFTKKDYVDLPRREGLTNWVELKRRMGLDELQNHGK